MYTRVGRVGVGVGVGVVECELKQASATVLLLTTPIDDGGRGQVRSTLYSRRRSWPVDNNTRRPAITLQQCTARRSIGREAASRGSIGVS